MAREISHAELEKYHYQALNNPQYQLEGMADVMREQMMMEMPYPEEATEQLTIFDLYELQEMEPAWSRKQWDRVQQLEAEIVGWRQKHALALNEIDKLRQAISPQKRRGKLSTSGKF